MIDAGVYPLNLREDKVGQREEKQEGLENAGRGTFAADRFSLHILIEKKTRN